MSIILSEAIQKNLGYRPLRKMDPNMQEKETQEGSAEDGSGQALIPAMLTGLFRFVQSDDGAEIFLNKMHTNYNDWTSKVFEDKQEDVIEKLCVYTGETAGIVNKKMNEIADEAVKIVNENLQPNAEIKEVKNFFINQKDDILLHLPAELHMGDFLDDNTLDDNTNRMEGPISSLIKNIGNAFTNPVTKDDVN